MDYRFYYLQVPQERNGQTVFTPKPFINIVINYKRGKMFPLKALVDSGSDINLFPAEIGEILGINIKKGKQQDITGIGGKLVKTDSLINASELLLIENEKRSLFQFKCLSKSYLFFWQ